jgi:hypothetical protein
MKFTILSVGIALFTVVGGLKLQLHYSCGQNELECDAGLRCSEKGFCKKILKSNCTIGNECITGVCGTVQLICVKNKAKGRTEGCNVDTDCLSGYCLGDPDIMRACF